MTRKIKTREFIKNILIIGEGETEKQYFCEMKREESLKYKITPELPQHQNYKNIFKEVNQKADYYEKIFCLIDLDYIINNSQFHQYKKEKDSLIKNHQNVCVIESCPCTETWFVLHFEDIRKQYDSCSQLIGEKLKIKGRMENYKKGDVSQNYYLLLKPLQNNAIKRADYILDERYKAINEGLYAENCLLPFSAIVQVIKFFICK